MNYEFGSIPGMFWKQVEKSPKKPAFKYKKGDGWTDVTWEEAGKIVKEMASGLLELGLKPGEKVAILSATRYEWILVDMAILSCGGVSIPIYPSNTPEQAAYVIQDSESRFAFVENKDQLEKIVSTKNQLPDLEKVIVIVPNGATLLNWVITLRQLQEKGAAQISKNSSEMHARTQSIDPQQEATYVYTSGTTGPPKGVVQTHLNHIAMATNLSKSVPIHKEDIQLIFLPLAHSFARALEFHHIYGGYQLAFAESIEKVVQNLQEVRPHMMGSVPRIFEKAHTAILSKISAGSPLKKAIFNWAYAVGKEVSECRQNKKVPSILTQIKHILAHKLVFSKIHQTFGGRIRFFISGGAPLSKEIALFFHALGMQILEGYGLTETCPATHVNRLDNYKFGTVGPAIPEVEVKIASDGEILVKGPNIAKGYFKKLEATREAWDPDGWFHTGDIGEIDKDGFLKITDRKKDLIVTAGGKNVAPQNIENLLKTDPYISQVMVYGDRKPYLTALITLDEAQVKKFAHDKGIQNGKDFEELAKHPEVLRLVEGIVQNKNKELASYESIKKFKILPADFTQETGELTPTLKVKRKVVSEKYKDLIERMYQA
ncbi:MAG: long-chain fatty acid--CoA ligase [Deltaproteobacteria bacterium]|nr:long-chain fatty acid--CoA ligase [Deltaproteobacteria bacterium]